MWLRLVVVVPLVLPLVVPVLVPVVVPVAALVAAPSTIARIVLSAGRK